MAKKKRESMSSEEPDLTPMIDVVFLLLIFFMLITEITQADLERMQLPKAKMAQPDKKVPKDRLIINIVKKYPDKPNDRRGVIKIHGQMLSTGDLIRVLEKEASIKREEDGFASARFCLIRCDRRVEYRKFHAVLALCGDPNRNIRIYKIQIAISKDQNE